MFSFPLTDWTWSTTDLKVFLPCSFMWSLAWPRSLRYCFPVTPPTQNDHFHSGIFNRKIQKSDYKSAAWFLFKKIKLFTIKHSSLTKGLIVIIAQAVVSQVLRSPEVVSVQRFDSGGVSGVGSHPRAPEGNSNWICVEAWRVGLEERSLECCPGSRSGSDQRPDPETSWFWSP